MGRKKQALFGNTEENEVDFQCSEFNNAMNKSKNNVNNALLNGANLIWLNICKREGYFYLAEKILILLLAFRFRTRRAATGSTKELLCR